MKIIHGYLARSVIGASLVTLLLLVALRLFFQFMEEIEDIGEGSYRLIDAFYYVLLTAPGRIYELFPVSVMIGGMLGLGTLASHSELTVLRAAGISTLQISMSVMRAALILMLVVFLLGEFVAPQSEKMAKSLRSLAISGEQLAAGREGLWIRDGQYYVRINRVEMDSSLRGIQFFEVDDNMQLSRVFMAQRGRHQQGDDWLLTDIKGSQILKDRVIPVGDATWIWRDAFSPDKLGIVKLTPESLNLMGLNNYIQYLESNELDSRRYQLAFWRKALNPVAIGVMIMLSLSFIFGPLRSGSMGGKILTGVLAGFAFDISNRILGDASLVYQVPPITGALLPILIVGGLSGYLLKKAG